MSSSPSRYPEERRLATVLFADVHGFTAMSEKLDYETVSDLLKGIWTRIDAIVEANGGYLDKHMGDGVMAVWGAPFSGDNDAEQAVNAALAMQTSLNEFASHTTIPGADQLKLRIGLNSGPVFAGYIGSRNEYTMLGDTVNVASRLEQMATPGTVVIGESTFRQVRGAFRVRRLPSATLKGKTEPVVVFVVDGVVASGSRARYRGSDSLATYMVCRETELTRLAAIYQQALTSSKPTLVIVSGEAGLGKSRLLMEFTSQLEIEDQTISIGVSRALAQASRVPFYLWKQLWHNWFGIFASDSPDVQREKFTREVARYWGKQLGEYSLLQVAHLIGYLTGIEWPDSRYLADLGSDHETRLRQTFEVTRELLRRMAVSRPTVLWIDDFQWADRSSLELLAYLFEGESERFPLLILAGARVEFLRMNSRWANLAKIVPLGPLPISAATVSAAYPDLHNWPDHILTELAQRSDGNPYFLEEMVKSLLKTGLEPHALAPAEMVQRLNQHTPESLRSMLQARLDDLPRETRAVALLASVVGRVFWVGAVVAAARSVASSGTGLLSFAPSAVIERLVQDGLRQLVRAELAFPRSSSHYSNEQEYIFKHSLLREVAYSLIPQKYLAHYHLAVGRWLGQHTDLDFIVMAADHLEQAGAYLEAAQCYEQAARLARGRGGTGESVTLTNKSQELRRKIKES